MRMTHAQMYARLLANDASYNGRFFTGVLTTGIYCLPSCRARKPRPENVRFFPTCEAAREAGLRACRKCHPDDYARGADPVLATIEEIVAEVRTNPAKFSDVRAMVQRSGFGATRAFELFRQHFHLTPAEVLMRARIAATKARLISSDDPVSSIALGAGFETLSAFHDNFRQSTGLTPLEYRALRKTRAFRVALPAGYAFPYLRRALSRDRESVSERFVGDTYDTVVRFDPSEEPVQLSLHLLSDHVQVEITHGNAIAAHAIVAGLLGLEQDAAGFARLARRLGFARLVAGRAGMRITQTASIFDGLLWAIIGQQINFAFACRLKRRLVERYGTRLAENLYAPPTPATLASLAPRDLLPLQFSQQKADYLIAATRAIVEGTLELEALRGMSATRAERTLLAIRGFGPWSVNYLMMRALGFADCVPLGDTGVTSGLQKLCSLEERPDVDATRRLMSVFSPFRSLATAHLWQFDRPLP